MRSAGKIGSRVVLIVEGGVKQNLYLEGGRGEWEVNLVDVCLSCPGTPQRKGRHRGVEPCLAGLHTTTGGYRSILEQADQCMYVCMYVLIENRPRV